MSDPRLEVHDTGETGHASWASSQGHTASAGTRSRWQVGVKALLTLVACAAVVLWAWRWVQDSTDPVTDWINTARTGAGPERRAAARELGAVGRKDLGRAIAALVPMLSDPDDDARYEAVLALRSVGMTAATADPRGPEVAAVVEALTGVIKASSAELRAEAIRSTYFVIASLGQAGPAFDLQPIEQLVTEALDDPSPRVRAMAASGPTLVYNPFVIDTVSARGRMPFIAEAPLLRALRTDPAPEVRMGAATTLGTFYCGSEGVNQLAGAYRSVYAVKAGSLRHGSNLVIETLFDVLERDDIGSAVRPGCYRALAGGVARPDLVPYLIDQLAPSHTPATRLCAVMLLGKLGADAAPAVPRLAAIVAESRVSADPAAIGDDLARQAAWSLVRISMFHEVDRPTLDVLTTTVRSPRMGDRAAAIQALSRLGHAAAPVLPELIELARESLAREPLQKNEETAAMVELLGSVAPGTPSAGKAVQLLTEALDSPYGGDAIVALRRFGPAAAPALPKLRALRETLDGQFDGAATVAIHSIEAAPEQSGDQSR